MKTSLTIVICTKIAYTLIYVKQFPKISVIGITEGIARIEMDSLLTSLSKNPDFCKLLKNF